MDDGDSRRLRVPDGIRRSAGIVSLVCHAEVAAADQFPVAREHTARGILLGHVFRRIGAFQNPRVDQPVVELPLCRLIAAGEDQFEADSGELPAKLQHLEFGDGIKAIRAAGAEAVGACGDEAADFLFRRRSEPFPILLRDGAVSGKANGQSHINHPGFRVGESSFPADFLLLAGGTRSSRSIVPHRRQKR